MWNVNLPKTSLCARQEIHQSYIVVVLLQYYTPTIINILLLLLLQLLQQPNVMLYYDTGILVFYKLCGSTFFFFTFGYGSARKIPKTRITYKKRFETKNKKCQKESNPRVDAQTTSIVMDYEKHKLHINK